MVRNRRVVAVLALVLGAAAPVGAQDGYPGRPMRILVGFTAGSGTDFLARTVGMKLAEAWGQPVVVDNRPGAGGTIASELLVRSVPDGHSMMVVANGHAVNAVLLAKRLTFDTERDFSGVTYLADVPNVLIVAPNLPAASVRELVALAKSKPGALNFGTAGVGSSTHLNAEVFNLAAGIKAVHVPYKGSPDLISNVISGGVQFSFVPIPAVAPLAKAGRVRALAVSTKARSPVLPGTPSIAEAGVPDFDFAGWYALFVPAKTPAAVTNRLSLEIHRILATPEVNERMLTQGAVPKPTTPAALDRFVRDEIARMRRVVKAADIRVE